MKILEHKNKAGDVAMTISHQNVEYLWVESEKVPLQELAVMVGRSYKTLLRLKGAGLLVIDGCSSVRCVRTFQASNSGQMS